MKIAYLFDTYPQLSETFLQREVDALRQLGFPIEVWALNGTPDAASAGEVRIVQRQTAWKFGGKLFFNRMGSHWARHQLGTVDHIHAAWGGHIAGMAMYAAHEKKLPWSFSAHARDLWLKDATLPQKMQSTAFASVCTRAGVAFLKAQSPAQAAKVLFAPHGLPLGEYPFTPRSQNAAPPRILAVGRLVEKKGFEILLLALKLLQDKNIAVEATLIGEGPYRVRLEKQARDLKLTAFQMKGALPQDEVRAHMQKADLLAAPCVVAKDGDHDGLPNVLLEAAALGLPLLTTPVGGTGDLVNPKTGWMCHPGEEDDLAEALEQVLAHPQAAFAKARAARRAVEEQYDVTANVQVLARAFTDAACKR